MNKLMQKISATCILLITSILLLDYNYNLLSSNTIFVLLYVITLFFFSIWTSFMFLQNVLSTNTPFKTHTNQLLTILHTPLTNININLIPNCEKTKIKPIDERIQDFISDIEHQFIKKWYTSYISSDEQFLKESSKIIDFVVRRFLQTAGQINSDRVLHGTVTILLRHVKEYKKAVKKTKIDGSVEGHYRYAHLGSKSEKCFEHFALQITSKTLRHFVHWELYNSVACRCLTAILARKLISHMIHALSSPGFINYRILTTFDKDEKYLKYQSVSISDVDHFEVKVKPSDQQIDDIDVEDDKQELMIESIINANNDQEQEKSHADDKEKLKPKEKVKEEVKVHESRSANKTWRHSSDLDCISLGQDILFLSNIVEEVGDAKPDWSQLAEKKPKTSTAITVATSIASMTSTANTVKDTMKDLQQSTSIAMHKIEDEAAGVVEGILDLGMAGIRKGLRLTGLQDNVLEVRPKSESKDIPMGPKGSTRRDTKTRLAKLSHVDSDEHTEYGFFHDKDRDRDRKKIKDNLVVEEESFEDIYMNPLMIQVEGQGDNEKKFSEVVTPGYEGDILLEKSPMIEVRTSSNDSNESNVSKNSTSSIPTMEFLHVEDSPEPEYEDNPDLATTTAKLRSLLAQKTEANTPLASPMSLIPTPQDASGSSVDELSEVDGALPSMYKAWAKTMLQNTLNTIKTALPGNTAEEVSLGQSLHPSNLGGQLGNLVQYNGDENWHFEEMTADDLDDDEDKSNFSSILGRFLSERQQFCVVDNAFEAVEAIDLSDQMEGSFILHEHDGNYEEELDDFDTTIPITKALVDLICELIEETYPPLVKENIVKTFLLTYGSVIEEKLQDLSEQLIKSISYCIGHLPKMEAGHVSMGMKIEELVLPIATSLQDSLGQWLSDESIKSILQLLLESLQSHKINVDTSLQIFELFVSEVIAACNQASPTYSV